jgi:hypothetical protein
MLGFINAEMEKIAVPYDFGEWSRPVQYPYWVGELTEEPPDTEDGKEEATVILTGTNRGDYATLEAQKNKIKKHFSPITGLRGEVEGGVIAAFYDGAFTVPTGVEGIKRIEVHLKIKLWKGDQSNE